ncbi:hypothetical protein [Streptomyces sp. NPDC058954]|uniref:hypothetical protein n=1 Tax=Streptomyces sp. NPDC058954 TaxID=3346677 RepID=UPI0036C44C2B
MRPTTRLRTLGLCACAVTLAGVLTACDSGKNTADDAAATKPAASAPPTTASSTAPADPGAREKAAVLAAYDRMTAEQAKAYRHASMTGTQLQRYATLDALGKIRLDLARMKKDGTVVRGHIGHDATVTALDVKASTPTATLSDCVDLSRYETYDTRAHTTIPLPTAQPRRYRATAKAERWNGRWMVTDIDTTGGTSC